MVKVFNIRTEYFIDNVDRYIQYKDPVVIESSGDNALIENLLQLMTVNSKNSKSQS